MNHIIVRWNAKVESFLVTEAITAVWLVSVVMFVVALDVVGVF